MQRSGYRSLARDHSIGNTSERFISGFGDDSECGALVDLNANRAGDEDPAPGKLGQRLVTSISAFVMSLRSLCIVSSEPLAATSNARTQLTRLIRLIPLLVDSLTATRLRTQ
jgi:hypothetical protein